MNKKDEAIKTKITKEQKPFYKKFWFWVVVLIVGSSILGAIGSAINKILDPDAVIPDVVGLTKVEACEKIENAGFICKAGSNYDSSLSDQRVENFYVYDKDGKMNSGADSSMRAPKSSTIQINFEETEKQKAEREALEAKLKADQEQSKTKEEVPENQSAAQNSQTSGASGSSEYDKISNGMKESQVDEIMSGYEKSISSESEILGSKYKYVGYTKGNLLSGNLESISVTYVNGVVDSKTRSQY